MFYYDLSLVSKSWSFHLKDDKKSSKWILSRLKTENLTSEFPNWELYLGNIFLSLWRNYSAKWVKLSC